jgi:hypothetical protein
VHPQAADNLQHTIALLHSPADVAEKKPRVKAPKQRSSMSPGPGRNRRMLGIAAAAAGGLLGILVVVALVGLGGGGPDEDKVRTALEAAGCALQVEEALPGEHSVEPGGTSDDWNTTPPTTGPHYASSAIFGIYEEPLEQARVVHNLEHGGIFIQYGEDVPRETVEALADFYDRNKNGTIMAPYPELGDEFALGAWVAEGEGNGYLATCTSYDEEAVSAFFDAFQFRGPERFDPSQLQPGL